MAGDPSDNPPTSAAASDARPDAARADAPAFRPGTTPTSHAINYATPTRTWTDEWRWLADTFSAERVLSFLRTLAWVAPLTLLIWVYAEREQVTPRENNVLPFKVVSPDPNTKVAYVKPGQASPLMVDLEGPRARVEAVLQQLRGGDYPEGLVIQLDRNLPPKEHTLPTLSLIGNLPIFRDAGITVRRVVPAQVDVVVEEVLEREAKVVAPPGVANLDPSTTFDPATVRVRGPASTIRKAEEAAENAGRPLSVYAQIQGHDALRTPGAKDPITAPIELPPELSDPNSPAYVVDRREVTANLHVRAADDEWVMPSMPVRLDVPKDFADTYTVDFRPAVANVKLIGPKLVIEQMKQQGFAPQPYAQLAVSRNDAGGGLKRKKLRFVDLPEGVRVADPDKNREFEFEVRSKAGGES